MVNKKGKLLFLKPVQEKKKPYPFLANFISILWNGVENLKCLDVNIKIFALIILLNLLRVEIMGGSVRILDHIVEHSVDLKNYLKRNHEKNYSI